MLYPKNIVNIQFGRLKVKEHLGFNKFNVPIYLCKCDCDKNCIVTRNKLVTGRTKSCGCLRIEIQTLKNTTHGLSKTRFANIYKGMRSRCLRKNNHSYKNYGGRGIKLNWIKLEDFYTDMFKSYEEHVSLYGEKNTSIDRIDVNGNYCKENCRWATILEQARNKRYKAKIVKPKIVKCISCPNCQFIFSI